MTVMTHGFRYAQAAHEQEHEHNKPGQSRQMQPCSVTVLARHNLLCFQPVELHGVPAGSGERAVGG